MDGARPGLRALTGWMAVSAVLTLIPTLAFGQAITVGPLTELTGLDALEQEAAAANQAIYNALTTPVGGGVSAGGGAPVCAPNTPLTGAGATAPAKYSPVFNNVRALVATASQLLTGRPNQYSLGIDQQHLGFALRWTAAEEVLAQGSIARRFANNQATALSSHVAAIRAVSRLNLHASNAIDDDDGTMLADTVSAFGGGGASADASVGGLTRWGLFAGSSGGWGDHKPTDYEDAFSYSGQEYSGGLDYRISNTLVVGAVFGGSTRKVRFDPNQSIVDGNIDSTGTSGMLFVQFDRQHFYATASVGVQALKYDITRAIEYGSNNPLADSVYAVTEGKTNSTSRIATLNLGVPFESRRFSADLYVKGQYQGISIDAYQEQKIAGTSNGFNQDVAQQKLRSFDVAAGVKVQAVWTPSFAVLVPYLRGEFHRELADQQEALSTIYGFLYGAPLPAQVQTLLASAHFSLSSEPFNPDYYTARPLASPRCCAGRSGSPPTASRTAGCRDLSSTARHSSSRTTVATCCRAACATSSNGRRRAAGDPAGRGNAGGGEGQPMIRLQRYFLACAAATALVGCTPSAHKVPDAIPARRRAPSSQSSLSFPTRTDRSRSAPVRTSS